MTLNRKGSHAFVRVCKVLLIESLEKERERRWIQFRADNFHGE